MRQALMREEHSGRGCRQYKSPKVGMCLTCALFYQKDLLSI